MGTKSMYMGMRRATLKDGSPAMSESEVEDEMQTIRGAGSETTGNTVCWVLMMLCQHPQVVAKLREELDHKVQAIIPTFEEARDLKYCHMILYETLRFYPTVPAFPRVAIKDTKVGGYDIPRGSMVFMSLMAMNRNPKVWDSPETFDPERFTDLPPIRASRPIGVPGGHPYGFIPFGSGPRFCAGQRLAVLESIQIIAAVVKKFDFE